MHHCLGFVQSNDLFLHSKNCESKKSPDTERDTKNILAKSRMLILLLAGALQQDYACMLEIFRSDIFNNMRHDALTKYVRTDVLILKYGMSLPRRHGRARHNDISQKMRSLARLVIAVRNMDGVDASVSLQLMISGSFFNAVLTATETICIRRQMSLGSHNLKYQVLTFI